MKDILYPLRKLHGEIHEVRTIAWPYMKQKLQNPNAIFLVFTPEHGNLGDHAIAKAEIHMLQDLGIDYIEITGHQLGYLYRKKWLNVMNGSTILINGGGNLGMLWFVAEQIIRELIRCNPRSNILILPNTIYYEDSLQGEEEFKKSKKIYNKHKHLRIYAREKISYSTMVGNYRDVKLMPDMVLSLNECISTELERRGCVLCLRDDLEKTRSNEDHQEILRQVKDMFGNNISYADMVVDHPILPSQRSEELNRQFDKFRHAELVVTDRLHGMIFCAITGTPCIVLNSKSPKIKGCYEWIRNLDYIKFANSPAEIARLYSSIPDGPHFYDNSHLTHYYLELEKDIKNIRR